jgi:hypothetical protein
MFGDMGQTLPLHIPLRMLKAGLAYASLQHFTSHSQNGPLGLTVARALIYCATGCGLLTSPMVCEWCFWVRG